MWNDRYQNLFAAGIAYDPLTATAIGLTMAGSAVSAAGTIAAGNAAQQAGVAGQQSMQFRADQERIAANESRSEAQRSAIDERRKGKLLQSTLIANAAASGGGVDDASVVKLGSDIAGRSEYQALLETYKGENRARGIEDQATADLMTGDAMLAEGEAKKNASRLAAFGTIIGGAGSALTPYKKFGVYG